MRKLIEKMLTNIMAKKIRKVCVVGENTKLCYGISCCCEKDHSIRFGVNCVIFGTLITQEDGIINIGDNVTIRYNTRIGAVNSIKIGNNVIISNNVVIYDNNNHPTSIEGRERISHNLLDNDVWKWKYSSNAPIVIEDNVWIGERATILKGVRIGKGAIVGMGAVVTKDVPEKAVVVGNPAKVVKYID